jgi:diphthamide biosynthesis methyltransferase|tara:strand:- start:29 stop:322 length:294 start_codon:yes stop_codon:yes gene_type:complete
MDIKQEIANMKGIPTQKELNENLQKGTYVVTFLKLDGDERVMTCTKSFDIIPKENQPKTDKQPKEGTITVWDVNAKGWRSFRYDRIKKVEDAGVAQR